MLGLHATCFIRIGIPQPKKQGVYSHRIHNRGAARSCSPACAAGSQNHLWHNTTRAHVWSFLSEKYKKMMNPETNYGLEEAGTAQLDDNVGALMTRS